MLERDVATAAGIRDRQAPQASDALVEAIAEALTDVREEMGQPDLARGRARRSAGAGDGSVRF